MTEPKDLFENKVSGIFWGSNVSGKSGFVNLVQIKQQYFKTWFEWLIDKIENNTPEDFKEELYEKLAFFLVFAPPPRLVFFHSPTKKCFFYISLKKVFKNILNLK